MFKINQDLAQSILNYLSRQPYADVYKLVEGVQNLEPIKEEQPDNG